MYWAEYVRALMTFGLLVDRSACFRLLGWCFYFKVSLCMDHRSAVEGESGGAFDFYFEYFAGHALW